MDTESIKSLAWLLVWGALFFVFMRFGCGVHMTGGHGRHGGDGGHGNDRPTGGGPVKDPVCGMTVDPKSAAAASVHGGRTYYFCSTSCREQFEKAPEKYAAGATHGGHHG